MSNQPRQTFQANISVQYVNQAKPGKKMGNIKDTSGTLWFVYPNELARVSPGDAITVEYTQSTGERGPSNFVTRILLVNGAEPVAPPVPGVGQAPQAVPAQYDELNPPPAAVVPNVSPPAGTPAPAAHSVPSASDKEEGMFIMSVVGRAMGSGNFGASDVNLLTKAAVEAWRNRHGDTSF